MDLQPYLQDPGIQSYLAEIAKPRRCREVTVDHLWLRMLIMYFPYGDGYLHHREDYSTPDSQIRSNVSLEFLSGGRRLKAFIIENLRPSKGKTRKSLQTAWAQKKNQLLKYMKETRTNQGTLPFPMIGAVCIRNSVKFFELRDGEEELHPFQDESQEFNLEAKSAEVLGKISHIKEIIDNARQAQGT